MMQTDPINMTPEEISFLARERAAIQNENKPSALYPARNRDAAGIPEAESGGVGDTKPSEIEATVETKLASTYEIKPVQWLWPGYLALGKIHILSGRPGCGKTTIGIKLAASTTTGLGWPDESASEPGNVAIWSGEDDPSDTLIPRLIAAGAKIDRVYFIDQVKDIECIRMFDPSVDMEPLQRSLSQIKHVKLLIIDPIVSAVQGDDHKNGTVRRALQPIADLAAALNIAVLGISHFTKNSVGKTPVERVTGSLAYGAAARIVLVAAKQKDSDIRIFCRAKSNIGLDDSGFEYNIALSPLPDHPEITASYVEWGNPISGEAQDLLSTAEAVDTENGGYALKEAKEFIIAVLKNGQVEAKEVKKEAKDAGIAERTLRRAREDLGVKISREGFGKGGKSMWDLQNTDTPPQTQPMLIQVHT